MYETRKVHYSGIIKGCIINDYWASLNSYIYTNFFTRQNIYLFMYLF